MPEYIERTCRRGSTFAVHRYGQVVVPREWWKDDLRERYCEETTDRSYRGANLHAHELATMRLRRGASYSPNTR